MSKLSDAVVTAWIHLNRTQRIIFAAVEDELKQASLPSLTWYDALWELERTKENLRPFQLQHRLLFTQYNLSRLIDRLQKSGYVEKIPSPLDGRGHTLRITAAGKSMRRRMWRTYEQAIQRHVGSRLSEAEAVHLAEGLALLNRIPGQAAAE